MYNKFIYEVNSSATEFCRFQSPGIIYVYVDSTNVYQIIFYN